MTHRTRTDAASVVGPGLTSPPDGTSSGNGHAGDQAGQLGHAVIVRLLTAGLELNSALTRIRDGPAADRVRHAVDELDAAIRDLRQLLLAQPGPDAGASRTAPPAGPASPGTASG